MATSTIPVLIVDDNPANLKLARFALEGEGYEVRTAPDGEAALTILTEFRPRLILMDLQLPGVDGLELTRRLKDDPATAGIVIVAVTAFAMSGDRERSRRAGCDGYLTKPIDPILLPGQVAEYLAAAAALPVLIVDDNPANLKLARFALEGEGYEVRTAPDGEAALTILTEFRPRLILMDLQLPGVDGLELTRRLKDDPATAGIVIVAVTAFAMSGDRERARRAGCDGYLTKPIDPILLPGQVAEYLAAAAALPAPKTPPSQATAPRESEE